MSGTEKQPDTARTWPLAYKGVPVPYIAAWSRERATDIASGDLVLRTEVFTGQKQLRYRDEQAADRDRHGILWHRVAWAPGQGRPLFADVHTVRQRRAMSRALCQICAGPAQVWMTPAMLWNEHLAEHGPGAPYPTNDPPVCRTCAEIAVRYCPEVGRGHLYLAPRTWAVTGVRGQIADPVSGGFGHPRMLDLPTATTATPDRTALRMMLAKGLVATLYDPTPRTAPGLVAGLGTRLDARMAGTGSPPAV
jgi:hypothetical protein